MLYITLFVMVFSFGNCRDTLPEVGAGREIQDGVQDGCRMRRTGLSFGSLQWIFVNRVTVKITCEYSLIYIWRLND